MRTLLATLCYFINGIHKICLMVWLTPCIRHCIILLHGNLSSLLERSAYFILAHWLEYISDLKNSCPGGNSSNGPLESLYEVKTSFSDFATLVFTISMQNIFFFDKCVWESRSRVRSSLRRVGAETTVPYAAGARNAFWGSRFVRNRPRLTFPRVF